MQFEQATFYPCSNNAFSYMRIFHPYLSLVACCSFNTLLEKLNENRKMPISKRHCTLESTCITEHFRTFLLQSFFTTTSISFVPMGSISMSLSSIVHLISDGVGEPPLTLHLKVFFSFSDRIRLPGSSKLT